MKIYFAGPLFTPYVRKFIEEQAKILRENGIEVFVPHEGTKPNITPELIDQLLEQGIIKPGKNGDKPSTAQVVEMVRNGKIPRKMVGMEPYSAKMIFEKDYEGLSTSNAVLVLLDGTQVDDGTACEVGIFYGLMRDDPTKKGVVGYITDMRGVRQADNGFGINLFVLGVIEEVGTTYSDFEDVLTQLKKWNKELKGN